MVFNFHGNSTSYYFTVFSGAKEKIGLLSHRFNKGYTKKIGVKKNIHSVLVQLSYLKVLNVEYENEDLSSNFFISEEVKRKVEERLKDLNLNGDFILIHPNATLDSKKWPEEKFAKLSDELLEMGYEVLFIGADFEIDVLKKIEKFSIKGVNYITVKDISTLGAYIKNSKFFICCDSGPMHIASALKKKILVIWGSSNFNVWHPWNTKFVVVKKEMKCSPCKGYKCLYFDYPKCIKDIEVKEVLSAFKELIEKD